jgi:hypothetical protein
MKTTIGGDRLGSGNKSTEETTHYNRSTHDLSYLWRSSAAAGTLIPFMSQAALPGDTWDIDLNCEVMTLPTIGPLFGSYKVQLDVFEVPIRLYNGKLHMNLLNVGMDMSQIKLPQVLIGAISGTLADDSQINPSSIASYLGVRGVGRNAAGQTNDVTRQFNAVPFLAYYDIFKCYYANKQEEKAYFIHNPMNYQSGAVIDSFLLINEGASTTFADIKTAASGTITNSTNFNAIIYATLGSAWTGQQPEIDFNHAFIVGSGVTRSINQMWQNKQVTYAHNGDPTKVRIDCWGYIVPYASRPTTISQLGANAQVNYTLKARNNNQPKLTAFNLSQIDEMRLWLLTNANTPNALQINNANLEPYKSILYKTNGNYPLVSSQEGLMVKTYQSDLFNNWIQTEWINGASGIAEITAVDTSAGNFTIDTLNLASKVYAMLNQIAISGGSYDDWLDAVYSHERSKAPENPIYHGSLIKELSFEEVISNAATENEPLGTLAGRGRLTQKHKGGKIVIKTNEPSYIIGIVSLTPRVDYSQGNNWDMNLQTINDFHKPALDQIAYQDLITDQLAWWDTEIINISGTNYVQYSSIGKQPAWLNYMTNVNKTYGSFAQLNNAMFMTLNRRYERNDNGSLKDATTYIDPVKFNQIFAETSIDAQNFWIQIANNITCRRKMSAKQIPNL